MPMQVRTLQINMFNFKPIMYRIGTKILTACVTSISSLYSSTTITLMQCILLALLLLSVHSVKVLESPPRVSEVVVYQLEDGSDLLVHNGVLYKPTSTRVQQVQVISAGFIECVHQVPTFGNEFWMYIGICIALVVFGGLMSGLTMGYFSIGILQ
jgi:hypothetical protein